MTKSFEFPLDGNYVYIECTFECMRQHEDAEDYYMIDQIKKLIVTDDKGEFIEVTPTFRQEVCEMTEQMANE